MAAKKTKKPAGKRKPAPKPKAKPAARGKRGGGTIPKDALPGAGCGGNVPPAEHRWKPGQSGNPAGRPTAGASIKEWFNAMQNFTAAEIKAIVDDPDAPMAKVAAARAWMHATSKDLTAGGQPVAGSDLDRILEHTDGRPKQAVDVTTGGMPMQVVDRETWDKV